MSLVAELAALNAERDADSLNVDIPNGTRTVRALARVTRRRQILVALGLHRSPTTPRGTTSAAPPAAGDRSEAGDVIPLHVTRLATN